MRIHRTALVMAWLVVSLVAVVGFANFTTPQSGPPAETGVFTAAPDLGSDAGSVSAMAFAYAVEGDVVVPTAPSTTRRDTTTTDPTPAGSVASGSTLSRSATLTETEVRDLVVAHFPADAVGRAVRAAWCASAFNPESINSGTGGSGLFQIAADQWTELSSSAGLGGADILDPEANTTAAAWMVANHGWSSLTCS